MRRIFLWSLLTLGAGCGGKELHIGGDPADGSTPVDGSGAAWPVTGQRNPRTLRNSGAHLYWIADRPPGSAILRCEKRDCANTVAPLVQVEGTGLAGFEIRGDVVYAVDAKNISSCSTSGCTGLKIVVAGAEASAIAFDEGNVYWSNRRLSQISTCSVDGCGQIKVIDQSGMTDALELAVQESTIYWIQAEDMFPNPPGSIRRAPKDGSGIWSTFAGVQNQAAALTIRDGFVYWATSFSIGTIARCPLAGCMGGPEILAQNQEFPHFVDPAGDMIFWMNGSTYPGDPRRVGILGCRIADCTATLEVLDSGVGGSIGTRSRTFPSRELVVDDDAIYWIGDIVDVGSGADGGVAVVGSIRRTERRRPR